MFHPSCGPSIFSSTPDVFSSSRPNGNSEMARSVDEIHDFLRDYFLALVDYNGE